jgi:uncharacterized sulfatase
MNRFNVQSYRWAVPLIEPFTPLQNRVLRDMYDAEIAYQDRLLWRMFRELHHTGLLENTLVIIVSDHGESHGDHNFVGHAFVIYNELVRVPLIIHYPPMFPAGKRVGTTISTRRLFHTILEAAGIAYEGYGHTAHELSLARTAKDTDPDDEVVVAEGFPPLNFIEVVERNDPEAIESFRLRKMRRAIYEGGYKLITVADRPDGLYRIASDPYEANNLLTNGALGHAGELLRLEQMLEEHVALAVAQSDGTTVSTEIDFSENPELLERLRGLGYIE